MSIRCQNWVYENSEARGNDRLVLLAIADEADDDGTNGHPGIDRISHKARVPKRTTMRCIERLEAAGWLVVHRPAVRGRGHFNSYEVVMGKGDKGAPFVGDEETVPERRVKARKGAQPYLERDRPIDPLTQDPTTTPPKPPGGEVAVRPSSTAFEAFYAAYPRHEGKGAAAKAWVKAVAMAGGDIQRIVNGALRYREDPNRDPAFTAHPATWLNAGRWDDDPLPPRNGRGPAPIAKVDQRTMEAMDWAAERRARREQG